MLPSFKIQNGAKIQDGRQTILLFKTNKKNFFHKNSKWP
jgi:hypothetical protein